MVVTHYNKDDLLNVGLAVRIFPATRRTFTKDTALSEHSRGAAWHVRNNGTAWHVNGMGAAWAWHTTFESALKVSPEKSHILF
jgi:hypothetical protein